MCLFRCSCENKMHFNFQSLYQISISNPLHQNPFHQQPHLAPGSSMQVVLWSKVEINSLIHCSLDKSSRMMNIWFLLTYHGFHFAIKGNATFEAELNEQYKHFCSFDIIYESSAGPNRYLTLVHVIYKANDYVGILE